MRRTPGSNERGPAGARVGGTIGLALAAALLVAAQLPAPPVAAAERGPRVPVEQATTRQKAQFVGHLVSGSVSAQMIEARGDEAAQASLAQARDLVDQAGRDLAAGDYEGANGKLDEALRLVNTEARKLSARDLKQARLSEAYDKRRNAVSIFLQAYERVAGEKQLSAAARAQVAELRQLVGEAEQLAAGGRTAEATEVLDRAYRTARGDIRELRDGQTLTRSLNFETPADEFRYERDRNDSHIMLLRFAIAEKNPPQARRARIVELEREATALRERADAESAGGDHVAAIDTMVEATGTLLKAIRMAGVWVPG